MINKVILVGYLGADPEIRHTQSGDAVAQLNLATSEKWKDQSGELQSRTEWHKVIAWKFLAETCAEHLSKGSKVYIEGKLQYRKYTADDGQERMVTEILAREVKFL